MRRYIEEAPADIQDLIYDGKMVEAVKALMQTRGASDLEAIRQVKKWRSEMSARFPEDLPRDPPYYLGRIIIWATLLTFLMAGVVAFIVMTRAGR